MSRQHDLPDSLAWRAIGRLEAGQTQQAVANAVGVSQSVISRLWNRFHTTGTVHRRPGQGRGRITTPREDRYVTVTARRHRRQNATELQRAFAAGTGRLVSTQTIRRRLQEAGLYARRPLVCPLLTPEHRRARRQWAMEHSVWDADHWRSVLFTDESRYSVRPDNRRVLIWRERGSRNNPCLVQERAPFGGGGVLVWAGISMGGRTDLYVIRNGSLTAVRYRDEILRPFVIPYAAAVGNGFLLMDDNARPHRAQLISEMLENEGVDRMDWPACSPDLNPIEHAWDMLGRRIAGRQPPPQSPAELERALEQEWIRIPQEHLDNLILSMPHRCAMVTTVHGDHTSY